MNPEIQNLYDDLEKEIENKIRTFIDRKQKELELNFEKELKSKMQQSAPTSQLVAKDNPNVNKPNPLQKTQDVKNLPWFANGIKGFLRKLWHGNSKSNPDWSVSECVTLEEYTFIRNELEEILMETEMLKFDDIKYLTSDLMITIRSYIDRLKKIKRQYNKKDKSNDLSSPEPIAPKYEDVPEKEKYIQIQPKDQSQPESNKKSEPIVPSVAPVRVNKEKKKAPESSNPLTFDEMKISPMVATKMAQSMIASLKEYNSNFSHDKLTSIEKERKKSFLKEVASKLEAVGLEIINGIKVARTRENAVKLVQILKEMSKIDELYNWKDVDNYFIAFPELIYPNMDQHIKDSIEKIENEKQDVTEQYSLNEKYKKYLK